MVAWWLAAPPSQDAISGAQCTTAAPTVEPSDSQTTYRAKAQTELSAIERCVHGYFAANTVADVSSYTRYPKRVQPMMVDYYRQHNRPRLTMLGIQDMKHIRIDNDAFVILKLKVQGEDKKTLTYPLVLEQISVVEFKIDWELDTYYQPYSWSAFLQNRPIPPTEMRVIVEQADYYDYAFSDASKYQCYKLTSYAQGRPLYGYAKRGSDTDKLIHQLLTANHRRKQRAPSETNKATTTSRAPDDPTQTLLKQLSQMPDIANPESAPDATSSASMILSIHFLRDDTSKRSVSIDSVISKSWIYQKNAESKQTTK